jgi:uncharacterized protein YkwD
MRRLLTTSALAMLLALIVAPIGSATPESRAATAGISASERALLAEVNRVRTAHGLGMLRSDGRLIRAARAHTQSMLRGQTFAHGDTVARLRRFGVRSGRVGENLAWGTGTYASAQAIVRMWLKSPGHRANLLHRGFRKIGLGTGFGSFAGHGGAIVVTADFQGT